MSAQNAKTVKDVMCQQVMWVAPSAKLTDVARKMQEADCGSVLVAENDRFVGVITDRDIVLRAIAKGLTPAQTEARSVMSDSVLYCRESDSITATIQNMAKNGVRRLLVVDSAKRLAGIVSLGDLAVAAQGESGAALASICQSSVKAAA